MMHTKDSTEDSGVDLPELLARVEYDRDFLREVVDIFKQEVPTLHTALKDAVACEDYAQIGNAAHTITGMLANLSITKATASAMCIGRIAREGTIQGMPEEMRRLEFSVA